jgi:hypothetical protein
MDYDLRLQQMGTLVWGGQKGQHNYLFTLLEKGRSLVQIEICSGKCNPPAFRLHLSIICA